MANLTQIGSVTETLPDQSLSIFSFPVTDVTVPSGSVLVVEVFTPDGRDPAFNSIYIGSNAEGQTGPSCLSAPDCGFAEPTDTASIGFPNMHLVLNVLGDDIGGSANEAGSELPTSVMLGEGYPNPFNPSATVPFTVNETAEVRLAVYDAQGREVAVLAAGRYAPGTYTTSFDAAGLPSGTYLTRLEANGQVQSRSLTLLK